MHERVRSIDFLRFLGALLVMLAHTEPPPWLFHLRNFGTPLLIVVAALSVVVVFRERPLRPAEFLKKRLLKLTVPAWLFLSFFFGVVLVYAHVIGKPFPFSARQVITSYALDSGIGYMWIFKVYLIVALLTPPLLQFKASVTHKLTYFGILAAAYVLYEVLNVFVQANVSSSAVLAFIDDSLIVVLPYSILFAYGLELPEMSDRQVLISAAVSLAVFAALVALKFSQAGHLVSTQAFKYPPTLYYLSYAFGCLNLLYLLAKSALVKRLPAGPIAWLSSNLLWIYLWHIMGLFIWNAVIGPAQGVLWVSTIKLAFVVAFGVSFTWLQKRILDVVHAQWRMRPTKFVQVVFG